MALLLFELYKGNISYRHGNYYHFKSFLSDSGRFLQIPIEVQS